MAKYDKFTSLKNPDRPVQVESAIRDGSGKNIENNYAKQDGAYPLMDVGYADLANNLDTKVVQNDVEAYNFRTSGGSLEIGNTCKEKAIVGGSLGWNQLVTQLVATKTVNGVTFTNNGDGSMTINGTATDDIGTRAVGEQITQNNIEFVRNPAHKYLIAFSQQTIKNFFMSVSGYTVYADYQRREFLFASTASSNWTAPLRVYIPAGATFNNVKIYPQVIDITSTFGSRIADYLWQLEQNTFYAGVAWFRKLFPKPYYPYKAIGGFTHVQTKGKKYVGFNQFNKATATLGKIIKASDGTEEVGNNYFHSDYIPCLPNTTYYFKGVVNWDVNAYAIYYDKNKNMIGANSTSGTMPLSVSHATPDGAYYMIINGLKSAIDTACVNFHYDGERDGEYEEYESETYPVDPIELKGIPQIDAQGNLYFDGDVYHNDGTVDENWGTKTIGENDLGERVDSYTNVHYFYINKPTDFIGYNTYGGIVGKVICTKAVPSAYPSSYDSADLIGKVVGDAHQTQFWFGFAPGTTLEQAKAVLVGAVIEYKLTAPTTSQATPFQEAQKVDNWGTEEFLPPDNDTRPVEVPVGHDTDYLLDIKSKVEIAPDLPSSDGTYVCNVASGTAEYIPLADWLVTNGYPVVQDLSTDASVITPATGLEIVSKKIFKIGDVMFVFVNLINRTGATIAANTELFTIGSGYIPRAILSWASHFNALAGNANGDLSIANNTGKGTFSNAIYADSQFIFNISYIV